MVILCTHTLQVDDWASLSALLVSSWTRRAGLIGHSLAIEVSLSCLWTVLYATTTRACSRHRVVLRNIHLLMRNYLIGAGSETVGGVNCYLLLGRIFPLGVGGVSVVM